MSDTSLSMPAERIEQAILLIRGHKVMLDADLAVLYGVTTSNLNKAVARNWERFPEDFMFQLTVHEFHNLTFQSGISSSWGGRRTPPMPLRSKASPCSRVSYGVRALSG